VAFGGRDGPYISVLSAFFLSDLVADSVPDTISITFSHLDALWFRSIELFDFSGLSPMIKVSISMLAFVLLKSFNLRKYSSSSFGRAFSPV